MNTRTSEARIRRLRGAASAIIGLAVLFVAAACSDKLPTEPPKQEKPQLKAIDTNTANLEGCWGIISPESPTIQVGGQVSMNVEFFCTDGFYAYNPWGTQWAAWNSNVVSLSPNGVGGVWADGIAQGGSYVEADFSGILALAFVKVEAAPVLTSVQVVHSSGNIFAGQTAGFTAIPKDQNGNPMSGSFTASWLSTNTNVGTVASTGNLTANGTFYQAGQTTIRATIQGKVGNLTVTVPISLGISGPDEMNLHEYTTYTATSYGGVGTLNHQWRYRRRQSNGTWLSWTSWFDYGTQNTLGVVEHECGIDSWQLEAKVTDSQSNTNTVGRQIWIRYGC